MIRILELRSGFNPTTQYPGRYSIYELINDDIHFNTYKFQVGNLKNLDVVIFQTPFKSTQYKHIGIIIGQSNQKIPNICHSSYINKGVKEESIFDIQTHKSKKGNTRFLPIAVKRLRQEFYQI